MKAKEQTYKVTLINFLSSLSIGHFTDWQYIIFKSKIPASLVASCEMATNFEILPNSYNSTWYRDIYQIYFEYNLVHAKQNCQIQQKIYKVSVYKVHRLRFPLILGGK